MSYSPIHTINLLVLESTPLMAVCCYCTIIKSYNAASMWFYTITVYLFDCCEFKTPELYDASFFFFFLARALYMHMILYCNYYALIVNSLSGICVCQNRVAFMPDLLVGIWKSDRYKKNGWSLVIVTWFYHTSRFSWLDEDQCWWYSILSGDLILMKGPESISIIVSIQSHICNEITSSKIKLKWHAWNDTHSYKSYNKNKNIIHIYVCIFKYMHGLFLLLL